MNIDVPKLARNNKDLISYNTDCGCYHCITIIPGADILDWTDDDTTAICPRCGVDSILPNVTNIGLLVEFCEQWFTTKADDEVIEIYADNNLADQVEVELNTLGKLKILEQSKNIYNIHYCMAGVGIVFYEPTKHDSVTDWEKGLNCKQYYPTFEECIAAEYAVLSDEQRADGKGQPVELLSGDLNMTNYVQDLNIRLYEYYYVQEGSAKMIGETVNGMVHDGWEVYGDYKYNGDTGAAAFTQRLRRYIP